MFARMSFWIRALTLLVLAGCGFALWYTYESRINQRPFTGPQIWTLRDLDSEITLLGTVHQLPPGLNWQSAAVDAALRQADRVIFETPQETKTEDAQAIFVRFGLNPPGETLQSLLTTEEWAFVARAARDAGIDPVTLNPFRPWLASLSIGLAQFDQAGFREALGVEAVLHEAAAGAGKRIGYLETLEQQLSAFADLTLAAERDMLVAGLRQTLEDPGAPRRAAEAWANGDGAAVEDLVLGPLMERAPDVYDRIIVARNEDWVDQIDQFMRGEGKILIAVGAGHLVGPDSIPAMLRAIGYRVAGPGDPLAAY